jgi:hypothetical protein
MIMKSRIIDYGIIIFTIYIALCIYSLWQERDYQELLLEDCGETIIKQRCVIDAQEEYIHFLIEQNSGLLPIHPRGNNFGPI